MIYSYRVTPIFFSHSKLLSNKFSSISSSSLSSSSSSSNIIKSLYLSDLKGQGKDVERLGKLLSNVFTKGDVIYLRGDLGAGKTSFSRGFIRSKLNNEDQPITSPTFLLSLEYPTPLSYSIFHMDLYRLKKISNKEDSKKVNRGTVANFQFLNIPSIFTNHLCLIEWPDILGEDGPKEYVEIKLKIDKDKPIDNIEEEEEEDNEEDEIEDDIEDNIEKIINEKDNNEDDNINDNDNNDEEDDDEEDNKNIIKNYNLISSLSSNSFPRSLEIIFYGQKWNNQIIEIEKIFNEFQTSSH